jgi:hypothetical protein
MRSTTEDAARRAQTSASRATIREIDDDHLMQEIKGADVFHSETATNFERMQPAGMTGVPMKQAQQDQAQQGQGQQGGGSAGGGGNGAQYNMNQPTGESSEAMISYANGAREHPVATGTDDRRVRPYGQRPGENQFYSLEGSGQTVFHRVHGDSADGLYLVTLDDQGGGGKRPDGTAQQQQARQISIRHANKKKQRRKKQQMGAGQRDAGGGGSTASTGELPDGSKSGYKHEGDSVNTEVQLNSSHINFNDGGGNKGYYDNGAKDWCHMPDGSKERSMRADKQHTHIKNDGGHVWVQGCCYKSMPFVVKPDPCT